MFRLRKTNKPVVAPPPQNVQAEYTIGGLKVTLRQDDESFLLTSDGEASEKAALFDIVVKTAESDGYNFAAMMNAGGQLAIDAGALPQGAGLPPPINKTVIASVLKRLEIRLVGKTALEERARSEEQAANMRQRKHAFRIALRETATYLKTTCDYLESTGNPLTIEQSGDLHDLLATAYLTSRQL